MKTTAATLALLAALFLAACGGGGGETTASPSSAASTPTAPDARPARGNGQAQGAGGTHAVPGDASGSFTPPAHHDSPTGAGPFEAKGGDNSIQEFGSEASGSDFEAAATALHGYLDARAAGAWSDACSYLAPSVVASLAQLSGGGSGGGASCPEAVASLSTGVPAAALDEGAEADVGALRTEGDRAFLLFRGAHGTDYFMPMAREGGGWKVAAIAPSAIQ